MEKTHTKQNISYIGLILHVCMFSHHNIILYTIYVLYTILKYSIVLYIKQEEEESVF